MRFIVNWKRLASLALWGWGVAIRVRVATTSIDNINARVFNNRAAAFEIVHAHRRDRPPPRRRATHLPYPAALAQHAWWYSSTFAGVIVGRLTIAMNDARRLP